MLQVQLIVFLSAYASLIQSFKTKENKEYLTFKNNNNNFGHESFFTFFSSYRQFLLGKVPYSIDSDNKLYCPVNICFRLLHWYCRLGTFDSVFTGCPTTEELEITGMFNFYYWNTGKLYHHAGKFSDFWNIGKRVILAQKATCDSS